MSRNKGALIGLALAAIAAVLILGPLASQGRVLLGLFLALTACVYLGALLAQKQTKTVAAAELTVGALVFLCSFLGVGIVGAVVGSRLRLARRLGLGA